MVSFALLLVPYSLQDFHFFLPTVEVIVSPKWILRGHLVLFVPHRQRQVFLKSSQIFVLTCS